MVSVALDQTTSAHEEFHHFLACTGYISVHSDQQQLFDMEQRLERANVLRRRVTERIYAWGKGKKRAILIRMKIAGVQIPIWL